MRRPWFGPVLLLLFVASGFAGLVYQSIWSHYLGLTLGHAAYAQTLVLAIFMGGMALGAWGVSRYSGRISDLIMGYAVIELVIGLLGLVFHPVFEAYLGFSHGTVLPAMGSPALAQTYQWLSAALLITPQSILLGATFPLMSSGYLRAAPAEDGRVLGGLYFTNSLGAAAGALGATFLLLPAVGMPGTVLTAAIINILVAIGAWAVARRMRDAGLLGVAKPELAPATVAKAGEPPTEADGVRHLARVMLVATFISGAASFVYEIGWVRMLNQALGTTIHSFELMLAAFILGLAFGGLWIRRRSGNIGDAVRYAGYVQVFMGVAALLSIPVFAQSFSWVSWLMAALARTDGGYTLFSLGSATIALLVMFPAAFFAGMTLPLFTMALLRAGAGESSIGRIYAANTLGAIAGVAIAVHLLIPLLGVRLAVTLAALVDALLGLYLLRIISPARLTAGVAVAGLLVAASSAVSITYGRPDPRAQASGVFRTGEVANYQAEVRYLKDGKTATISVSSQGSTHSIATNGKPDASLTPLREAPTNDEITMIMAGVLPLALHPEPERIAIIGWGSGLTTHTVLGSPVPQVVDNIEIERAMHEGARLFGERVERAYEDPRSKLHVEDARTFFATGARSYDVIVSEPSNPWVSGVATLFTKEFYAFLDKHLEDDGILIQWLQSYEIDDALVATMLAALIEQFPESEIYLTNHADLLIVARKGTVAPVSSAAWQEEVLRQEMIRVGLGSPEELGFRRIGGPEVIANFVRLMGAPPYSDFFPKVSLEGPRTRFTNRTSSMLQALVMNGLPVLDVLDCRTTPAQKSTISKAQSSVFAEIYHEAWDIAESLRNGRVSDSLAAGNLARAESVQTLLSLSTAQEEELPLDLWTYALGVVAGGSLGALPAEAQEGLWKDPQWAGESVRTHPVASVLLAPYAAAAERDPKAMLETSLAALALEDRRIHPVVREQILVIAMLGSLGVGEGSALPDLEARFGDVERTAGYLAQVRAYLLAWADGGVPTCLRPHVSAQEAVPAEETASIVGG
ncbi:MAG TPA: fused MFS/spermidine synthase [Thiobacillus sp.]